MLHLLRPGPEEGGRAAPDGHARLALPDAQDGPAAHRPGERDGPDPMARRRAQRGLPEVRPRRLPLHHDRGRRQPDPARPPRHRPGHQRPPLVDPPDRRGPRRPGEDLRHPRRQPLPRPERGARRGLVVRVPEPLEDELRPRDGRPVGGRRRLGDVGARLPGRTGGQLRVERHGGEAVGPPRGQARAHPHPPADDRLPPLRGGLGDGRVRLPGVEASGPGRHLHLRRLGLAQDLGGAVRRQEGHLEQAPGPGHVADHRLRRGQPGGALHRRI